MIEYSQELPPTGKSSGKIIQPKKNICGKITVPGDKSISHRSVMFGAIAKGITEISGFLTGEDCFSTINCFRKMGIEIQQNGENVLVKGNGLRGLKQPISPLDVENSGTTIRLISGILAGQNFESELSGDSSIRNRPMDRIVQPLSLMGAKFEYLRVHGKAPFKIKGAQLSGIEYYLPVASAQVKSAVLLAGLYAEGETKIFEPQTTRNHTEIMLNNFGANIKCYEREIICKPVDELYGRKITVPGDISSAAFFIAAAIICENSEITIENVGINTTRDGIITALKSMGANIELENIRFVCGEKIADLKVKSSDLKAIEISGEIIPVMIDEVPIFAVCALFAEGTTVIKDAAELKLKESNRISAMVTQLRKMGAVIEETDDGMIIEGRKELNGAVLDTYMDHRIAMSLSIAALKAKGETVIKNADCCDVSFPGFFKILNGMSR